MIARRIAVDGSALAQPWTGMGTYSRELLSALSGERSGDEVTVYTPFPGTPAELRKSDIRFEAIPATRLVGKHLLWPAKINRSRPDVFFGINGFLPLGILHLPSVVTVHDLAIYREPAWFPRGQPLGTRLIVPRSLAAATRVIAISHNTAKDLRELFSVPPEKIDVVLSGVSPAYRPLPVDELEGVRQGLGLAERFVLFVGTIQPRKNVETLVRAWSMLADRPQLVIAGGYGWRFAEAKRLIDEFASEIRVLGPVRGDLLPPLYNLAVCLAHPAWYEGFGQTPLEAMACGTPVVCSNRSSLPEVVGDAAVLVDPADVEGWSEALRRVLEDRELASSLAARGRERAAQFSWRKTARETWSVLDAAASRSRTT